MSMKESSISRQRDEALESLSESERKLPNKTMSRVLYSRFPNLFAGVESARSFIRSIKMANGTRNRVFRGKGRDELLSIVESTKPELPEPVTEFDWEPYELPAFDGIWLVMADTHFPFYNRPALEACVKYAKRLGKTLKGILLNGDIADQYCASWWPIDPRVTTQDSELRAIRQFFAWLQKELPGRKIVWKKANHEARFERAFIRANPSMACSDEIREVMSLEYLLGRDAHKQIFEPIDIVQDGQMISYKGLAILHGDEIGRGAANLVNPARTAFIRTKSIVMVAHSHQTSGHMESDLWGTQLASWSIGCLCHLHPKWWPCAHLKWNHGFALIDTRGTWGIDNKRILDGGKVV